MSEQKTKWFKGEVRLDNLLIIVTLIGGMFVGYAKYVSLTEKVDRHDMALENQNARMEKMAQTQATTSEALAKLTIIVEERTAKR